jgi:diguanylate cyclase (GGDEF)-like protein
MRSSRPMWSSGAVRTRMVAAGAVCVGTTLLAAATGASLGAAVVFGTGVVALALLFGMLEHHAVAEAAERGRRQAGRDPLTDLASGAIAEHFVATEFAAAQRGRPVTIVVFGLDDFNAFATRHGAAGADRAVREFGQLLKRLTRRMNLSARYGWRADAFISVLSDASAESAEIYVQRVRAGLAELGTELPMPTFSAGIAEYEVGLPGPEAFVESAERALAEARAAGGNTVRVRLAGPSGAQVPWLKAL